MHFPDTNLLVFKKMFILVAYCYIFGNEKTTLDISACQRDHIVSSAGLRFLGNRVAIVS